MKARVLKPLLCNCGFIKIEVKHSHDMFRCCVAEVKDNGRLIRIHFDGWTDYYDYWTETDHPDIHPIGFFEQCCGNFPDKNQTLQPPKGMLFVPLVTDDRNASNNSHPLHMQGDKNDSKTV